MFGGNRIVFKIFFVIFEGKLFWNSQKAGKLAFWLTCSSLLLPLGCGGGGETGSPVGTGSGTATLSWKAPTENADGTSLTGLAGYKVYYGTASGNYNLQPVTLPIGSNRLTCTNKDDNNDGITDRTECTVIVGTVEGLISGTYYFAVTTYDTSGNESEFSNEVSKTIQFLS